jgi:hypothetical protein
MNFTQSDIGNEIEIWIHESCIPVDIQYTTTHIILWPLYNRHKFIRIMPYFLDRGYRYNLHQWYKDVPSYTKIKIIDFVENSIEVLILPLENWKQVIFPYIFPRLPFLSDIQMRSTQYVDTSLFLRSYWVISTHDLYELKQYFFIFPCHPKNKILS